MRLKEAYLRHIDKTVVALGLLAVFVGVPVLLHHLEVSPFIIAGYLMTAVVAPDL